MDFPERNNPGCGKKKRTCFDVGRTKPCFYFQTYELILKHPDQMVDWALNHRLATQQGLLICPYMLLQSPSRVCRHDSNTFEILACLSTCLSENRFYIFICSPQHKYIYVYIYTLSSRITFSLASCTMCVCTLSFVCYDH